MIKKIKYTSVLSIGLILLSSGSGGTTVGTKLKIEEKVFLFASNRGTAYIENDKILSYKDAKFLEFLEFLDFNGTDFLIHLVHINKNKIVEDIILDTVFDNHGGGSIAFNNEKKVCIVYDGHHKNLKYRCSKDKLSISSWDDIIYINDTDSQLTYPSFMFDQNNTMHLLYRKINIKNKRTDLVYMKTYENNKSNNQKKYLYSTNDKYSNFTATLVNFEGDLKILFKDYGYKFDNTKFNKGVYLYDTKLDKKITIIAGQKDSLEKNFYVSNLLLNKKYLVFNILNYTHPNDFFKLYMLDSNFKIEEEINLINLLEDFINFSQGEDYVC